MRAKTIALFVCFCCILAGCKTVQKTTSEAKEVVKIRVDTIATRDTVRIVDRDKDSTIIKTVNDTVFVERWKTRKIYTDRVAERVKIELKTDTVQTVRTVLKNEKPRKIVPTWALCLCGGVILMFVCFNRRGN